MKSTVKTLIIFSLAVLLAKTNSYAQQKFGQQYYLEREKTASPEIKALLARLRAEKAAKNLKFTPAYTEALDRNLGVITGGVLPPDFSQHVIDQNKKAQVVLDKLKAKASVDKNIHLYFVERLLTTNYVGQRHFDWRDEAFRHRWKIKGTAVPAGISPHALLLKSAGSW